MRIALATCSALPGGFDDGALGRALLRAGAAGVEHPVWDDPAVDWAAFDRVVIRSPWDYVEKRAAFVAWVDAVGPDRLRNRPALVAWNSDKRYLSDLAADGVPVVATEYVGPGDRLPELAGEVVVKPSVSAGARDTGRFGPAVHDAARALIGRILADGRTAMVQPYLPAVDDRGETAVVCFGGEISHVLHKKAVLRADEEAPLAADGTGAAQAMYDPDLVTPGRADPGQLVLARRVMGAVAARFGSAPLIARVDMVPGDGGAPVLLELEAIEPALYLDLAPGAADRLARAALAS